MINVLIVEDSKFIAALLSAIINNESDFTVLGIAQTGEEAITLASRLQPDIITMDIRMPKMNGLEAIEQIMQTQPKPIVVISSNIDDELQISFQAIDKGALAVLEKPSAILDPNFSLIQRNIIETLRAMTEVKLIKRRCPSPLISKKLSLPALKHIPQYELLVIGSSTGGPQVLKLILSSLPIDFYLPIVITQHISQGFIKGLQEWLNKITVLNVKIAEQGEVLQAGNIYLAPDNYHCRITKVSGKLSINLNKNDSTSRFIPSISVLFHSVSEVCPHKAIGIILSGMGNDGAQGLLDMHNNNCLTIAQDEHSCIVFGMPKVAIELNAVDKILPAPEISRYLLEKI